MKSKLCSLTGIAALVIMLIAPVCVADKSSNRMLKQQERYTLSLELEFSKKEGVGAALILPAIVALVAGNFPVARRPAAYGMVAAAGAIAVAVGPLIGGVFTTYFSWRWVSAPPTSLA